jgi:hypothetical protein
MRRYAELLRRADRFRRQQWLRRMWRMWLQFVWLRRRLREVIERLLARTRDARLRSEYWTPTPLQQTD